MRPRILAVLAIFISMLWFSLAVQAQKPDIIVKVSDTKGFSGNELAQVAIYTTELSESLDITTITFNLTYDPDILEFVNIKATDTTTLGFIDDGIIEQAQGRPFVHFEFTSKHPIKSSRTGDLMYLLFKVIGLRGSIGKIHISDFSFGKGKNEPTKLLSDATFRVYPTAIYYNDRNIVEITDSEVFTNFELETTGELNYSTLNVAGWQIDQVGSKVFGRVMDKFSGATTVSIPLSEVDDIRVYSLKVGDTRKVQYVKRNLFLPFAHN